MTTDPDRWTIQLIRVQDMLGYQGSAEFNLEPGLQVIAAPNHTGKTSLAIALQWGLTGAVPDLARVDGRSFRLTNRHAGANAMPEVEIVLITNRDRSLGIKRIYGQGRRGADELTVTIDDDEFDGDEAAELLERVLGVKPASISGCGVVLQDHRLRLITGEERQISDVINDMLGLINLTELVPALEESEKEARALSQEIDAFLKGGDPLQRFEEKEQELKEQFESKESEATSEGFTPEQLQDPKGLTVSTLGELAGRLSIEPPAKNERPTESVQRMRTALSRKRQSSPESKALIELQVNSAGADRAATDYSNLVNEWQTVADEISNARIEGSVDVTELSRIVTDADKTVTSIQDRRTEIRDEQGFLQSAYDHLIHNPTPDDCPLCGAELKRSELTVSTKERLESKLAQEIEELENRESQAGTAKADAAARLSDLNGIQSTHRELVIQTRSTAESRDRLDEFRDVLSADTFSDTDARGDILTTLTRLEQEALTEATDLRREAEESEEALISTEQNQFKPIEDELNRLRDVLVPLLDSIDSLEAHAEGRAEASRKSDELTQLHQEARQFSQQVRRIAGALSKEEQFRAEAAVQQRLPFISDFF